MIEPVWVDREALLRLHEESLVAFGGAAGLRDPGLLESALARPQQLFAYGSPDLASLAAAYAFGIAKNHTFIDGNKRAAFLALAPSCRSMERGSWRHRPKQRQR